MLNNRDFIRVLNKVKELEQKKKLMFTDYTIAELKDYVENTNLLLDYIVVLEEGLKQDTVQKGYYFAEYDENSLSYCVFHTDLNSGRAYSSFSIMQEATRDAQKRNYERTTGA